MLDVILSKVYCISITPTAFAVSLNNGDGKCILANMRQCIEGCCGVKKSSECRYTNSQVVVGQFKIHSHEADSFHTIDVFNHFHKKISCSTHQVEHMQTTGSALKW